MDCQELLMFRSGDVLTIANADWFMRARYIYLRDCDVLDINITPEVEAQLYF